VHVSGSVRQFIAGTALSFACASVIAGCAGGSTYGAGFGANNGGGGGNMNCVTALPPAGTQTIGVNLTNPNQAACDDPTYSSVKAYFGGSTVTTSQVISVTHSGTNVVEFTNLDIQPHTAASLGPWSGSYPPNGPDPAATASPTNTDISAAGFTTGNLDPGTTSNAYLANVPGFYIIGCAYHYNSDNMRTVIIVQ